MRDAQAVALAALELHRETRARTQRRYTVVRHDGQLLAISPTLHQAQRLARVLSGRVVGHARVVRK